MHPGEILKIELVEGRKISVSKIAELLDTTNSDISNILKGPTESPLLFLEGCFEAMEPLNNFLQDSYAAKRL